MRRRGFRLVSLAACRSDEHGCAAEADQVTWSGAAQFVMSRFAENARRKRHYPHWDEDRQVLWAAGQDARDFASYCAGMKRRGGCRSMRASRGRLSVTFVAYPAAAGGDMATSCPRVPVAPFQPKTTIHSVVRHAIYSRLVELPRSARKRISR